jgi:hypothetical protein
MRAGCANSARRPSWANSRLTSPPSRRWKHSCGVSRNAKQSCTGDGSPPASNGRTSPLIGSASDAQTAEASGDSRNDRTRCDLRTPLSAATTLSRADDGTQVIVLGVPGHQRFRPSDPCRILSAMTLTTTSQCATACSTVQENTSPGGIRNWSMKCSPFTVGQGCSVTLRPVARRPMARSPIQLRASTRANLLNAWLGAVRTSSANSALRACRRRHPPYPGNSDALLTPSFASNRSKTGDSSIGSVKCNKTLALGRSPTIASRGRRSTGSAASTIGGR